MNTRNAGNNKSFLIKDLNLNRLFVFGRKKPKVQLIYAKNKNTHKKTLTSQ